MECPQNYGSILLVASLIVIRIKLDAVAFKLLILFFCAEILTKQVRASAKLPFTNFTGCKNAADKARMRW